MSASQWDRMHAAARAVVPLAPTVRDVGDRFVIDWPEPRPEWFPITSEAFEALIESVNDARNALESGIADAE